MYSRPSRLTLRISRSSGENSTCPQTATCTQRPALELMYWKLLSSSSLDELIDVDLPVRFRDTELHDAFMRRPRGNGRRRRGRAADASVGRPRDGRCDGCRRLGDSSHRPTCAAWTSSAPPALGPAALGAAPSFRRNACDVGQRGNLGGVSQERCCRTGSQSRPERSRRSAEWLECRERQEQEQRTECEAHRRRAAQGATVLDAGSRIACIRVSSSSGRAMASAANAGCAVRPRVPNERTISSRSAAYVDAGVPSWST